MGLKVEWILDDAARNMKKQDVCAKYNCRERTMSNFCKKNLFGTYKDIQKLMLGGRISSLGLKKTESKDVAECLFNGDRVECCHYIADVFKTSYTKVKKGEFEMKKHESEALRKLILASKTGENLTIKQIAVPRHAIAALRASGVKIVSQPGPKGGYRLSSSEDELKGCIEWVNNWRKSNGMKILDMEFKVVACP